MASEYNNRELYKFSLDEVEWLSNEFLLPSDKTRGGRASNNARILAIYITGLQVYRKYLAHDFI